MTLYSGRGLGCPAGKSLLGNLSATHTRAVNTTAFNTYRTWAAVDVEWTRFPYVRFTSNGS